MAICGHPGNFGTGTLMPPWASTRSLSAGSHFHCRPPRMLPSSIVPQIHPVSSDIVGKMIHSKSQGDDPLELVSSRVVCPGWPSSPAISPLHNTMVSVICLGLWWKAWSSGSLTVGMLWLRGLLRSKSSASKACPQRPGPESVSFVSRLR